MHALLDLLLPPTCPGCGQEGAVICTGCAGWLGRRLAEPAGVPGGLLGEALAGRTGERVTMVQFSSAFCQPCRATRRILEEVAVVVPGVAHVEIDAEHHLDLVRELDVRRTPTVLFVDAAGVVRKQASGQPRKADVIAALGELIGPADFEI